MDKLTQLKQAIAEILADDRVTKDHINSHERWRVTRDDGTVLHVHQVSSGASHEPTWAAFFEGSTPEFPRPTVGLGGSRAPRPELAVMWALLD